MKYSILSLLMIFTANLHAQFVLAGCYDFSKAVQIKTTDEKGLFRSSSDYLSGTVESVDKMSRQPDGLSIKENGKFKFHKYEDLATDYWGFVDGVSIFRFCSTTVDGFKPKGFNYIETSLQVYGKLCLYGTISISDPIKNSNGGYNYNYTYFSTQFISLGLDGDLYDLTNYHFSQLLEKIDADLYQEYMDEFAKIAGAKLHTDTNDNKETMKLFIKYFELVNNSEADNK